jgi:hypothetical protein
MSDLVNLSALVDLPFTTVRVWLQKRRRSGRSDSLDDCAALATPSVSDSAEAWRCVLAVVLREDNPTWPETKVAALASLCLPHRERLHGYVSSCINAFILRGYAKILRDDPTVDREDAKTIAMFAFVQKVANASPR